MHYTMIKNLKDMSTKDLEDLWLNKMNELFEIKKEIDRRKGEPKPLKSVEFTSYVTK